MYAVIIFEGLDAPAALLDLNGLTPAALVTFLASNTPAALITDTIESATLAPAITQFLGRLCNDLVDYMRGEEDARWGDDL